MKSAAEKNVKKRLHEKYVVKEGIVRRRSADEENLAVDLEELYRPDIREGVVADIISSKRLQSKSARSRESSTSAFSSELESDDTGEGAAYKVLEGDAASPMAGETSGRFRDSTTGQGYKPFLERTKSDVSIKSVKRDDGMARKSSEHSHRKAKSGKELLWKSVNGEGPGAAAGNLIVTKVDIGTDCGLFDSQGRLHHSLYVAKGGELSIKDHIKLDKYGRVLGDDGKPLFKDIKVSKNRRTLRYRRESKLFIPSSLKVGEDGRLFDKDGNAVASVDVALEKCSEDKVGDSVKTVSFANEDEQAQSSFLTDVDTASTLESKRDELREQLLTKLSELDRSGHDKWPDSAASERGHDDSRGSRKSKDTSRTSTPSELDRDDSKSSSFFDAKIREKKTAFVNVKGSERSRDKEGFPGFVINEDLMIPNAFRSRRYRDTENFEFRNTQATNFMVIAELEGNAHLLANHGWNTGIYDTIGEAASKWHKREKALCESVQSQNLFANGTMNIESSIHQTSRFELPLDMKDLENMSPQTYLEKYCIISSRRQVLYQKMFLKHKDVKTQCVPRKNLDKIFNEILIGTLTPDQLETVLDLAQIGEEADISQRFFYGLCALTERLFFLKNMSGENVSSEMQRESIEIADFFALDYKFKGVNVNPRIMKLLKAL